MTMIMHDPNSAHIVPKDPRINEVLKAVIDGLGQPTWRYIVARLFGKKGRMVHYQYQYTFYKFRGKVYVTDITEVDCPDLIPLDIIN